MNLSTLTTTKLSEIKAFCRKNNILPASDLRLKQSWIDAAQAFLTPAAQAIQEKAIAAYETATSHEAVEFYKSATVATFKFTRHVIITACLLTIALGMSTRDTWIAFQDWLQSENLTLSEPEAIARLVIFKARQRIKRVAEELEWKLMNWADTQTERAKGTIALNAIAPAQELRNRINAARFVITH